MTTVVLLGEAVRLLGDEIDDIRDVEILERYLPVIEQLKISFILPDALDQIPVRDVFTIRRETDETINDFVRSIDCALVF